MSESKREEAPKNQQPQKQPIQSTKNNPFSSYINNNNHSPRERDPHRRRERSISSRRSSRSRSRDKRYRDKPQNGHSRHEQKSSYDRREYRDRAPHVPPRREQHKDETYFKTKICPLYQKGQCKKGAECSFAHSEKQIRGLPNFKKTRLCIAFKSGECAKASEDCRYAHGQGEIRKIAYDYVPPKYHEQQRHERYDRDRPQRNDRYDRPDRRQRYQRSERDDRSDRQDRRDRERERQRQRDRYRYKERQSSKDRQRESYYSKDSRRSSANYPYDYPQGPYMSSYNTAYMIPPGVGGYGAGESYPSSAANPSVGPSSNYVSSSSMAPGAQSYLPPYNMGSYEYGFGYHPQNYPPFGSSSSKPHG